MLKIFIIIVVIIIIYFVINCLKNKKENENFQNQYTINDLQFNPNFQSLDDGDVQNKDIRFNYRNIKKIYRHIDF